jgi:uncharacterized protein YydD (DUF2326 family)
MYLKLLKITSGRTVIREMQLKKGMNLIVDDTPTLQIGDEDEIKTGNNVGKTTVLKLIDFCLGAKPTIIYSDIDSGKQTYDVVKDFLIDNNVKIILVLKKDLDDEASDEVVIERNFLLHQKSIRRINGKQCKDSEFEDKLRELIFPDHTADKPSFRQIISHNIRYKDNNINNTLKTLDRYTSDAEYETLYLFLFGCNFDEGAKKQAILTKIKQESVYKDRLEKQQTRTAYEAALSIIDDEIEVLDQKKGTLNLNENFERDLDHLNNIKYEINKASTQISNYELRKSLILETQQELGAEESHIDLQQLKMIYSQASNYFDNIQKTFEELVAYHNKMVSEKVRFITKDLPYLEEQIKSRKKHLRLPLKTPIKAAFYKRIGKRTGRILIMVSFAHKGAFLYLYSTFS